MLEPLEPRYRVPQVAEAWSVTPQHVYRLIATGELGCIRIGKAVRVRKSDIEAYKARQSSEPPAAAKPDRGLHAAFERGQAYAKRRQ